MHPLTMFAVNYVTFVGYCSLAGRVLARSCKLMSSNQAVAGVAIYAFFNLKVLNVNNELNLTLPNWFAYHIIPNYREASYDSLRSRFSSLVIASAALAPFEPSEVLALFMISEISIGFFERDYFPELQCAGILINMGASYLLTKKFSMMNPVSAASEALLISLVQLLFSIRISEIFKGVYLDRRTSRLGRKLFRALDKLAFPLSILIYSANAYSRGISPKNIVSLLSITTIGTQLLNRD